MLFTAKDQLDSLIVTMSPGKGISPEDVKEIELSWWGKLYTMGLHFWADQLLDYTENNEVDTYDEVVLGEPSPWLLYVKAAEKAEQLTCNFRALTVESMGDGIVLIHGEKNVRFVILTF